MSDVLIDLTSLAISTYRALQTPEDRFGVFYMADGVLREMQRVASIPKQQINAINESVSQIFADSDFAPILQTDGDLTPMVLSAGGGSRMSAGDVLRGIFASAAMQIYCLRLRNDESTFVRTVLDNFEELRRALRGERVRAHAITGIAGITLHDGCQATTPWGVLRPVPEPAQDFSFLFHRPKTSCILAEQRLATVKFDLSREPKVEPNADELRSPRAHLLFPVSCALSSKNLDEPAGAVETWSTYLLPFQQGFGYSQSILPHRFPRSPSLLEGTGRELEEWARIVDSGHSPAIDVAATRLITAIGHRHDAVDSLIDTVMAWENLLGTATETTFRVTAAISKLLEPNQSERRTLRKDLADIYGLRSRLVHGAVPDRPTVEAASKKAIAVAIEILRRFYRRGPEWTSMGSQERADILLLEE